MKRHQQCDGENRDRSHKDVDGKRMFFHTSIVYLFVRRFTTDETLEYNKITMDEQANGQHASPSLILSIIGWAVAAFALLWFFLFAKSNYYRGSFAQGVSDQNAADKLTYEQSFGLEASSQVLNDTRNLRVIRLQPGSIIGQEIVLGGDNPFAEGAKQQTVTYDEQTKVVRRVVLQPAEMERRLREAQDVGENPMLIPPFDDLPATIDAIKPGDRLEVIARDPRFIEQDSFVASLIAIVVEAVVPAQSR